MRYSEIMIFNLADHPERAKDLFALLAAEFPKGEELSQKIPVEEEFFLLLAKSNWKHVYFKTKDQSPNEKIVATASFRFFDFEKPKIKICGIGLVVTRSDFRGQHHSFDLQTKIEADAKAQGATLALLWSDLEDFYKKQGYWPSGTEYQWDARDIDLNLAVPKGWHILRASHFERIQKLYDRSWGPKRNWAEYEGFLQLPDTFGYECINAAGDCVAYCLLGKGRDLRNSIHEVGGSMEGILLCIQEASRRHLLQRLMLAPDFELEKKLTQALGLEAQRTALGYLKILDLEHLVNSLQEVLPPKIRIQLSSNSFELKLSEETVFTSQDPIHLLQICFGPWRPDEMEDLPESMRLAFKNWHLPSLYFWGMDSV